MTDIEINKALALAIGWQSDQIIEYEGQAYIGLPVVFNSPGTKLFDYRFTSIIWPIAKRYNCFASRWRDEGWCVGLRLAVFDTPEKAVAMAVIGRTA